MRFSHTKLVRILKDLCDKPRELERFDFKRTDTDKLGQYFSALSNEANLKGESRGWLIFGVDDKTHDLMGTDFRKGDKKSLDDLKKDIANQCGITFFEIYDVSIEGKGC